MKALSFFKSKVFIFIALLCLVIGLITVFIINTYIKNFSRPFIVTMEKCPQAQAAIVLGAAVWQNKYLSHILQDRMDTAISLYKMGKVKKLLLSGDHGKKYYDEVNNMLRYALQYGIIPKDFFLDHAGFRTYDTMYRARDVFKIKSAIIVTQKFHLARAVYIARKLGIQAIGITADKRLYQNISLYKFREFFARLKAYWQAGIIKPKPKFLGKVIPITGDGRLSHDE
ncbi:MAG: YdcF family protein [Spirochaetes bacterium]|nr:YdcF family protein [Spirochaetota bacterium]